MWLHSSMTDRELVRSVIVCNSPYLRLLADRIEARADQLDKIAKLAADVNGSTLSDQLQAAGFEDIAQLFCQIESLTKTERLY